MKELLDIRRAEFCPARHYVDEQDGRFITFDPELAKRQYSEFVELHDRIRRAQSVAWGSFIEIGYALLQLREEKIYYAVSPSYGVQGYGSFYKFCQDVFGIKQTTAKNLINVALNFGDEEGRLRMDYAMYSYSQLVELTGIEKAYRERVPSRISVRDMAHLRELYREYTPKTGTVDDDLKEWKRRHDEKEAEKNRKKNAITFFPADPPKVNENNKKNVKMLEIGQTSDRSENGSTQTDFSEKDGENGGETDVNADDESIVSTPDVPNVTFDSVRTGLMAQLSLLIKISPIWTKTAQMIEKILRAETPFGIVSRQEMIRAQLDALGDNAKYAPQSLPPAKEYIFKNDTERKAFLDSKRAAEWPLWIEVPALGLEFRRIDFLNGDYLVARFGNEYGYDSSTGKTDRVYRICKFYLCTKEKPVFDVRGVAPTYVIDYLKSHKAELAGTELAKKASDEDSGNGEDINELLSRFGSKRLHI